MKTFILSAMLCLATLCAFGQNCGDSDTPVPIIMMGHTNTNQSNSDNQERSILYWELNAYVYPTSGVVEVNLYNIGNVTISLVNADGEVVDSAEVDTSIPSTVTLQVDDSSNIYYIVVTSSTIYAEGCFGI
ncbi:MAG: hypothetical protein IKJ92_04685 [Bacteroidaceae bacterium]|nr:hypothetical protein [Bacteroidaceae bacterium]